MDDAAIALERAATGDRGEKEDRDEDEADARPPGPPTSYCEGREFRMARRRRTMPMNATSNPARSGRRL